MCRLSFKTSIALALAFLCLNAALLAIIYGVFMGEAFTQPKLWQFAVAAVAISLLWVFAVRGSALESRTDQTDNPGALFQTFVEACSEAMVVMDSTGRVACVNRSVETLLGFSRNEMINKSIEEFLYQDKRSRSAHNLPIDVEASSRATTSDTDLVARCKDGRRFPVEITCSPLELADRILSINIIRDISEQKGSERRRALRHLVRRILADSPSLEKAAPDILQAVCELLRFNCGVLWLSEPSGNELRCLRTWRRTCVQDNGFEAACQAMSLNQESRLAGQVMKSGQVLCIQDLRKEERLPHLAAALADDSPVALAFPIICDNHLFGVIECFRRDHLELDDRLVETLVNVGTHLGRFMRQKQAEEAVRASEARKAAVLESALDAIITVDEKANVVEFNPMAQTMFGYAPEDVIGKELDKIFSPTLQAQFRQALSSSHVEGEGFRLGKRFETTALTREGRELPIEVAVTQFQASSRSLLTIFIRDVSERKAAEESLTRTQEQLRHSQKLEAVGRLAGGVAHDFNNMLTVINGYAESLCRGISKDNRWLGPVTQILQAGKRASVLTRQLLAFSRKQVLEPKIFNLNDVLRDMTKLLSRVIGEDIELSTVLASDASHIKADPGQMEQVIMNLAVNARDAMPHGGKLILETMNVELDENYTRKRDEVKPGPYVMLAVTDTGCGMTESVKARVFEPFFTTKEVGKGTGLGLAMVYGIIKQSGGHIAVYSEPERGTTFKIYLPCGGEKAELPVFAATEGQPAHQAATGTVLLVEDEDMVRELTKDVLQSNGYTVLEARHGVEALELYKDRIHSIDLTLTDVVMPQMNGRAFASNLLSIRPDMKILYMSGYTDNAITRTGILENGSAFLQKPFTADSLISKLRDLAV